MKKFTAIVLSLALIMTSLSSTAHADTRTTTAALTDGQLALVRTNCSKAQTALDRIRKNDALSRIYLGQEYETISYNFMAPMNNRIATTRLDGTALTKTTASFSEQLDDFHSTYLQYTQAVNGALAMRCTNKPQEFYDKIMSAYNYRTVLKKDITELESLAKQYQQQAVDLKPQLSLLGKGHK